MSHNDLPCGPLCFDDLKWEEKHHYGNHILVSTLPEERLDDFVEGQGHQERVSFSVYTTQKQQKDESERTKVERKVTFNCCHGPKDNSKNLPPEREASQRAAGTRRRPTEWGEGIKLGCRARFHAIVYIASPRLVTLHYTQRHHVTKAGQPAHPPGTIPYQRFLSVALRRRVADALLRQVAPRAIIEQVWRERVQEFRIHNDLASLDEAEAQMLAHPMTRDDCLNSKDVANISQTIDGLDWKYDPDQARSLHAFAAAVPEHVLHYQPQDSTTDQPFQMVFSKPSMLKLLVEHGHGRPLLMDSTFGTNNLKFPLYTLAIVNARQKIIPVVWMISSRETADCVERFLQAALSQAQTLRLDFMPGSVHCDDAKAEQLAIKQVFPGVPILLCAFHVKQAWGNQLVKKTARSDHQEERVQKELGSDLDGLMRFNQPDPNYPPELLAKLQIDAFLEKYGKHKSCLAFVEYFKTTWAHRPEAWMQLFRNFQHCNQETTGGVEAYHKVFKELFLNPAKFGLRSRRLDWLVPRILGPVCTYYLRIQHEEEAGHGYNKAAEDRMRQTVANAFKEVFTLEIPEQVGESVTIRSSSGEVYHVMGPGTAEAACECIYFMRGNICKHIVKVARELDDRLEQGHFMKYLGARAGSSQGGMEKMYGSLPSKDEVHANGARDIAGAGRSAAGGGGREEDAGPPDGDLGQQVGGLGDAGGVDRGQEAGGGGGSDAGSLELPQSRPEVQRNIAAAAVAKMLDLAAQLDAFSQQTEPDDTFWSKVLLDVNSMDKQLRTRVAEGRAQGSGPLQTLSVNPEAVEGWGLKRLKGFLEKGRKGKRGPAAKRTPLAAEAQGDQAPGNIESFAQLPAQKSQGSVLQKALGSQTAGQQGAARLANQRAIQKAHRTAAKISSALASGADTKRSGGGELQSMLTARQLSQDENIAPAALGTIGEKEVEAMVDQGAASASAVMVVPVEQSEEDQRIVLLPVQQEMPRVSRSGRTIAKSSRFSSYVTD